MTNQSTFLSPQSSGQGSQFKELCLTHVFPFPKNNCNLKTLKAPPTLPKQKPIPRAHSVQRPGRALKNNIEAREGSSCCPAQGLCPSPGPLGASEILLLTCLTLPPSTSDATFPTLAFNFLLHLGTGEKANLGVPFSLMVGPRA